MEGHIRGPGDVSVPGATVELINLKTGERKETWSDGAGNYVLKGIAPGTYKLQVNLLGFRPDVRQPVPVAAGKTLKVGVALRMALPPEAGPANARRGPPTSPGSMEIPELSAQARGQASNMADLGNLAGGENMQENVRFSGESSPGGAAPGGNGAGGAEASSTDVQASASNSFLLAGGVARAPTPGGRREQWRERIREFRRMQSGQQVPGFGGGRDFAGMMMFFGGRFGHRPQINRVRGNIFERYSNSAFDAHSYPLNVAESPRIPSYQEQLGVSIGGPLNIPKLYNGGGKTSFFVHYNLQRSRSPFDSFATVPTLAEREGNFSGAVIPAGQFAGTVPTVYEPTANLSGPRTPFPGNMIPQSDQAALGLLKFIPQPNLPGSVQNFHLQEALQVSNDRVMARVGHQLTSKDAVSAFYFFNSQRSHSVANFPGLTSNLSVRGQNLNLTENHTFSADLVNNLVFNFNRQRSLSLNPFANQQNVGGDLGILGISQDPLNWGPPAVSFTNFTGLNEPIPSLIRNQTMRVFDFLLWNHGNHNFRFGGEVRRVGLNTLTDPDARGTFTFSGFATSDFTPQGFPVAGTGFDFADFLLGLPQATTVRYGTSSNYFRSWVYSLFAQDDWRLASKLTFNIGLRYEYFQPFTEKYGHLSDLALSQGYSSAQVVTGLAPGALPNSLVLGDNGNLAPRIGLAYRPWLSHSLVFRAGYGLFYDDSIYQRLVPNLANQPPFAQASTLLTSSTQVLTLENGFPTIGPNTISNTYAVDPNFRTPYGQTWNFGFEDEVARNVILSVNYVGTKGTHLDLLLSPNQAASGSPLTTQQRLGLSNALQFTYETSGAASIYNGLQVGLRRQFHNGLSVGGEYTFAKSIDNAASVGGAGSVVAQDPFNLAAERGLSAFDVRHNLLVNYIYEFPWGENRRWLHSGGALSDTLGNWQISGNTTIQSGTPFTARLLGNLSNNGGTGASFAERANATGLPVSLPGSEQTTLEFFNTSAFALPAPGELGNAGRNTIPGPGTINFDMALSKRFTFSRDRGIGGEFRIEANNVFNTPNFSGLATVVNATDFGRVTSVNAMRSISLDMRLRF